MCHMSRRQFADAAWKRLAPLPRPPRDHRTMANAMLWLAETGASSRDPAKRCGPGRASRRASTAGPGAGRGRASAPSSGATAPRGGLGCSLHPPRTPVPGPCRRGARPCRRTMGDGTSARAPRRDPGFPRVGPLAVARPRRRRQQRLATERSRGGFTNQPSLHRERHSRPTVFVLTGSERREPTAFWTQWRPRLWGGRSVGTAPRSRARSPWPSQPRPITRRAEAPGGAPARASAPGRE